MCLRQTETYARDTSNKAAASNKVAAKQDDTRSWKCCKYEQFIMHVLCAVFFIKVRSVAAGMAMLVPNFGSEISAI